jgi:vancomycin resistance protein VanJ
LVLLGRVLWSALRVLVGAFGLSLTAFLLLRWTAGESLNGVAIINNMLHLMLLPVLVLLPLALVARLWVPSAMMVVPFAFTVATNAPMLMNGPQAAPPNSQEITVLTYNLLSRNGDEAAFADTLAIIREADADVVALQEVSVAADAVLQTAFPDDYPYRALHPKAIGTQGQGVLSRYPIVEDRFFQSPLPLQLGHQRALLDVDGREVVFYNVHPVHPFMTPGFDVSVRSADIGYVLDQALADAPALPTLIMGDFNMTPMTADYGAVTATFTDVYGAVGQWPGYTFPSAYADASWFPLARLDYVFHDADWRALSATVWDRSGGGDHRPLFVRLALLEDNS